MEAESRPDRAALREAWSTLSDTQRATAFRSLTVTDAEELFHEIGSHEQASLIAELTPEERRHWLRTLDPDDAADLIQEAPIDARDELLALFDDRLRREVTGLLAYAEDAAGGLMNPRFSTVRPDMTADEALAYLRRRARERYEITYYVYVLDGAGHVVGVCSIRTLLAAVPGTPVRDMMHRDVVTVPDSMEQEELSKVFSRSDLLAIPVLDKEGRMKGIVTVDDIVDVVQEEATEDIQKYGGMEALDKPYMESTILTTLRKRGGWLMILFLGEMLTTNAVGLFHDELQKFAVLAVFMPLIISSGGNSGSQASTLVIRALVLGELRLRDWWRIAGREVLAGLALGGLLGAMGLARVGIAQALFGGYGDRWWAIGITIAVSLVGVVTVGTVSGSMLPLILRRLGFDPASASAPFVATVIDVTGLLIYFSMARLLVM